MTLLTEELKETFKKYPLNSQENEGDEAKVLAHFFNPLGAGDWFVLEAKELEDGDYLFFGYVNLLESEYGYFTLKELESVEIPIYGMDNEVIEVVKIDLDTSGVFETIADVKSGKFIS